MQADTFGRGRMKGREVFPTTCKISDFVNCLLLHNVAQADFPLILLFGDFDGKDISQWWQEQGKGQLVKVQLTLGIPCRFEGHNHCWSWIWREEYLVCETLLDLAEKIETSIRSFRAVCPSCNWITLFSHHHTPESHQASQPFLCPDSRRATEGHKFPSDDKRVESVVDLVEAVCVQSFGKRADGRTLLKSKLPLLIVHQYTQPPSPFKSVQCSVLIFQVQNVGRNSSLRISVYNYTWTIWSALCVCIPR